MVKDEAHAILCHVCDFTRNCVLALYSFKSKTLWSVVEFWALINIDGGVNIVAFDPILVSGNFCPPDAGN